MYEDVEFRPVVNIKVKKVYDETPPWPPTTLPSYGSTEAACADIRAYGSYVIQPGEHVAVGTGLAFEIPFGYEIQVRARSGLSKRGLMISNGIGTIDSDYVGEIKVLCYNTTKEPFLISHGERIAQVIPVPVTKAKFQLVDELTKETERGAGGFGSSGVF